MLIRFGQYVLSFAKPFGCPRVEWTTFGSGKRFMSLEYVPDGGGVRSWTRMMTVTLYLPPAGIATPQDTIKKRAGALLAAPSRGKIRDQVA